MVFNDLNNNGIFDSGEPGMGDVTVYKVATQDGNRIEALRANSQSGRAKFFEVGDAVEMSWPVDAGHFISE